MGLLEGLVAAGGQVIGSVSDEQQPSNDLSYAPGDHWWLLQLGLQHARLLHFLR